MACGTILHLIRGSAGATNAEVNGITNYQMSWRQTNSEIAFIVVSERRESKRGRRCIHGSLQEYPNLQIRRRRSTTDKAIRTVYQQPTIEQAMVINETIDEEIARATGKKGAKLQPGITTYTDNESDSGFHVRTKIADPVTDDVFDLSNPDDRLEFQRRQSRRLEKEEDEKKWKPLAEHRSKWGGAVAIQNKIYSYQMQLQEHVKQLLEEERKNPALKEHSKEFKRKLGISVIE